MRFCARALFGNTPSISRHLLAVPLPPFTACFIHFTLAAVFSSEP
jgi:hypothetical protein